ncbi:hypothetical protein [Rhodococcus sp. NPDC057529]|uniref:hypothetical protein n=1 Tax=Rhodococcus sp. NPDC057529 TaxID=3346158 RepID=UPI00366C31A2
MFDLGHDVLTQFSRLADGFFRIVLGVDRGGVRQIGDPFVPPGGQQEQVELAHALAVSDLAWAVGVEVGQELFDQGAVDVSGAVHAGVGGVEEGIEGFDGLGAHSGGFDGQSG